MDLNNYVNLIKSHYKIKFLALHVDQQFASIQSDARPQIRQNIVSLYSPLLSSSEKRALLNLNSPPVVENLFFSITHNKSIGGYAACDQKVGFDMEEVNRLSMDTISRVSSSLEIAACPDFRLLWSAKEAALKTTKQLLVMSDIEVLSWLCIDNIFYFEANSKKAPHKTKGAVFISNQNTMACCFVG